MLVCYLTELFPSTERTPDEESCIIVFPNDTEYEYSIPVLKVQAYTPEMMAEKGLIILFPFSPIRFRNRLDKILEMEREGASPEKIRRAKDGLKKNLTKFMSDCIMIINREEENGTLRGSTGADIVEYMGRNCDYIFSKEPELLKGVHEIMEPVIKLIREEAEDTIKQKDDELKLLKEQNKLFCEQKNAEIRQMEERLDKFLQNYICQCKREGKVKEQTEKELQEHFALPLQDVRAKMEKWW